MWIYFSLLQLKRTELRRRLAVTCSPLGLSKISFSFSRFTMLSYVFVILVFSCFFTSVLSIPVQHQPKPSLLFTLKLGEFSSTIADYDRSRIRALKAAAQSPGSNYKRTVFSNSDVSVNVSSVEVWQMIFVLETVADSHHRQLILLLWG